MSTRPKTIYASRFNLSGLYGSRPYKCTIEENGEFWVGDRGYFCVDKLGLKVCHAGYITYASVDKRDVEIWIAGVRSVGMIMPYFGPKLTKKDEL